MDAIPIRIYSTKEWGAKPAKAKFPLSPMEGICIHNTASPNRAAKSGQAEEAAAFAFARGIQAFHMGPERGWSDTGQHFTVSRGGLVLEGRHGSLEGAKQGKVPTGAHAGHNAGHQNRTWFGIEVEGSNSDAFHVLPQQWTALVELCAWLCFWSNVDSQNIKGHKEFSQTDCPGHIMEHLPELRQKVHDRKVAIRA